MNDILLIDNLNCYYGKSQVIHNLSIRIKENEICCLLGSNGAGKTTLLSSIAGLIRNKVGNIYLGGIKIDKLSSYEIARMGISFSPERAPIFPQLRVYENLKLGGLYIRDKILRKEREKGITDLFPVLSARKNQLGGTLSGGERQMLSIGMALMSEPKLLMLDEPSMGLAPLIISEIFKTIEGIRRKGKSIFLVEQNANIALRNADRGYLMELGKIVLEDDCINMCNNANIKRSFMGIE